MPDFLLRTITAAFLSAIVALTFAAPAGATTTDTSGTRSTESQPTTHIGPNLVTAPRASRWKCGRWKDGQRHAYRWCVRFTKIRPVVKKDGVDLLHNNFNRRRKMHCTLSRGTTWTFHASGTVKAEAGVIFAKASAEVTVGGSRSTTTTSTTGAEFWVRAKRWAYCARGHAGFRLAGETKKVGCDASRCLVMSRDDFTGRMPANPFFEIGPGRDINWKQFLPY